MTIQDTIKKAIEGGYDKDKTLAPKFDAHTIDEQKYADILTDMYFRDSILPKILLDLEAWKCLGKAMGWKKFSCIACYSSAGWDFDECVGCRGRREIFETETWKVKWHESIAHLAKGKSIESYFEEL